MEIDRRKILQDALEMARHNYYCFSRWEGKFDEEEQEEKEKIVILETMIKELPGSDGNLSIFTGYIVSIGHEMTVEKKYICSRILLDVDSGFEREARDKRIFFMKYYLFGEWFRCIKSYLGHYFKENGSGRKIRVWVNSLNYIEKMEWVKEGIKKERTAQIAPLYRRGI